LNHLGDAAQNPGAPRENLEPNFRIDVDRFEDTAGAQKVDVRRVPRDDFREEGE
jgi:hypothetical protein